jgi:Phosphoribosylpyrophosphate synthetase
LETPLAIFAGRSNAALARAIADSYGAKLGRITIRTFSDGELYVKFEQASGRGHFPDPVDTAARDNIMELLLMLDAAKRASVKR